MAIPAAVTRIVLSGKLYGGERWSSGFFVSGAGITDAPSANSYAGDVAGLLLGSNAWSAMSKTASKIWSTQTNWDHVGVYSYLGGGPAASQVGSYVLTTPVVGTSSSGVPNQCACVVSTRSGLAGRRHRGRMYLPLTGYGFSATGQLQQADASFLASAWAAGLAHFPVANLGQAQIVSSAGSSATPITSVIVDTRVDIQRSRAKQESVDGSFTATL